MYGADNDAHHRYSIRGWMAISSRMALPCLALRSVRSTGVAFQRTAARLTLPQNSKGYDAACTERRTQTNANNTRSPENAHAPKYHRKAHAHTRMQARTDTCTCAKPKRHTHMHTHAHSPHMHTACALTHVHASTDGRTGLLTCDQTHLFDGPHVRLSSASSEYLARCEWD
jgi:hypothetical protein